MKPLPHSLLAAITLALCACQTTAPATFETTDHLAAGIFFDEPGRDLLPEGVAPRHVTDAGLRLTETHEGWRSNPYNDSASLCTIGYGHLINAHATCEAQPPPPPFAGPWSHARGDEVLAIDMHGAEHLVQAHVMRALSGDQFDAVCDFAFNLGSKAFIVYRKDPDRPDHLIRVGDNKIKRFLNAGQFDLAAQEMLTFVKGGPGLLARRKDEVALLLKDVVGGRGVLPQAGLLPERDVREGYLDE
jgi:GH24 family phage-related lysozyme (muramidase)